MKKYLQAKWCNLGLKFLLEVLESYKDTQMKTYHITKLIAEHEKRHTVLK